MEEVVKNSILSMLDLMIKALIRDDPGELSVVSNNTIHSASIYQDEDSISIAVIAYALSKTCQHCSGLGTKYRTLTAFILRHLQQAKDRLKKDDYQAYRNNMKHLIKTVSKTDKHYKLYIGKVMEGAKIKKGSVMYAHGISIGRVAEVLGISQWELMNYLGKTTLIEGAEGVPVKQRIAFTRRIFNL